MRTIFLFLLMIPGWAGHLPASVVKPLSFFAADHPAIQYSGRIDFSNKKMPRFWAPGVTVRIKFIGPACRLLIHDEVLYGNSHNYVEIAIDDRNPYRIQTRDRQDTILVTAGDDRRAGEHLVTLCKDTESGIGYLEFAGVLCEGLSTPPPPPTHKIEFIGNSITCGTGMDQSSLPCGQGQWYDQHNAWLSYGPLTARSLHAQWQLTAVSGIGLMHSCCNMNIVMPQVFDKINQRENVIPWDFKRYTPDVVTVCLGQNDGIQDSAIFCGNYLGFIRQIRSHYQSAQIVCLTSPMGNAQLTGILKRYLTAIRAAAHRSGDLKVDLYFYSKQYSHGCGGHPDLDEHRQIAAELTAYLKKKMGW